MYLWQIHGKSLVGWTSLVKGLKMGSRRLKIKESSDGGFGGGNSGGNGLQDENYRPSTSTPIRMRSPVMFEK